MYAAWRNPETLNDRIDSDFYSPEYLDIDSKIKSSPFPCEKLGQHLFKVYKGAFYILASEYNDNGYPFIRVSDITTGFVDLKKAVYLSEVTHLRENKTAVRPGNLLFAKGGSIGNCAVVPDHIKEANISQDVIGAQLNEGTEPYYIIAYLNHDYGVKQMIRWTQGNVHPHITNESIKNIYINFPDNEIQRAIANKYIKSEKLIILARELLDNISSHLFEVLGPIDVSLKNSKSYWTTSSILSPYRINPTEYSPHSVKIEQTILNKYQGVCLKDALKSPKDISGGATPSGAIYSNNGIGFLRVQNIQPNRLDKSDLVFIDEVVDNGLRRSRLKTFDIVLTITGFPGSACCVQADDLPLNINQHSVRFHLSEEWDPFFVAAFLNSDWGKAQVDRRAIGGTRDALDYPSVLSILIPRIDYEKQKQIGGYAKQYADYLNESSQLVKSALSDINEIIAGTLDSEKLIEEGNRILNWLANTSSQFT